MTGYATSLWDVLLVLLLVGGSWVYSRAGPAVDRLRDRLSGPQPTAVEQLEAEYAAGELDLDEFERRVGLALDDRACRIRDEIETVDGVGPERSALIADRFDSIEDVRRASRDELTTVDGVGPSTAADIRGYFD